MLSGYNMLLIANWSYLMRFVGMSLMCLLVSDAKIIWGHPGDSSLGLIEECGTTREIVDSIKPWERRDISLE